MNECNLQKNKKQTYQKTISLVPDFMTCVGVHRKMRHPSDKKGRGGASKFTKEPHIWRDSTAFGHISTQQTCGVPFVILILILLRVLWSFFFFSFSRFCLSFLKLFLFCFVECIFWGGTVLNWQVNGGGILFGSTSLYISKKIWLRLNDLHF